jgi:hypothetical protein
MLKKIAFMGLLIILIVPLGAEAHYSGPSLSVSLGQTGSQPMYYLDATSGNDANDGRSSVTPWKTIAKVNGYTFSAGDRIFFKRGEIWRESLTVPGDHLTFGAYGTGNKPIISGGDEFVGTAGDWTQETGVGDNIWSRPLTIECKTVIFIKTGGSAYSFGAKESAAANINAEYEWFWGNNKLYVYSNSNPANYFTSVEAAQREHAIICYKDNIIFNDIVARNTGTSGAGDIWYFSNSDVVLNRCEGFFCSSEATSNALTNHNTVNMIVNECNFGYATGPAVAFGGAGAQIVTMNRCTMVESKRGFSGIAGSNYTLNRCWINNCTYGFYKSGNLTANNCIISHSSSYAFYWNQASDTIYLNNCTFYDGSSWMIYADRCTLIMRNCILYRPNGSVFRKSVNATYTGDNNVFYCDSNVNLVQFNGIK